MFSSYLRSFKLLFSLSIFLLFSLYPFLGVLSAYIHSFLQVWSYFLILFPLLNCFSLSLLFSFTVSDLLLIPSVNLFVLFFICKISIWFFSVVYISVVILIYYIKTITKVYKTFQDTQKYLKKLNIHAR